MKKDGFSYGTIVNIYALLNKVLTTQNNVILF